MASAAIAELRRIRTTETDDPEKVLELGQIVLTKGARLAGDEYWTILDQLAVAGMIVGNDSLATKCIETLAAKFPTSPRTYVLMGMHLEAQEKLSDAAEYYEYVLTNDPTNIPVWKRRAALLRSLKRPTEAINQLTLFLDTFPNDTEAWAELADLYLSQELLSQAAFCFEELILLHPFSHYMHTRYAEVLWRLNRNEEALKYWCRSVELCSDFLRGWFGIVVATKEILGDRKSLPANIITLERLNALAKSRLLELSAKGTAAEKSAIATLIS